EERTEIEPERADTAKEMREREVEEHDCAEREEGPRQRQLAVGALEKLVADQQRRETEDHGVAREAAGAEKVEDEERAEDAAEEELQHGVEVLRVTELHLAPEGHEDHCGAGEIAEQNPEIDRLDGAAEGHGVPDEAADEEGGRNPGT